MSYMKQAEKTLPEILKKTIIKDGGCMEWQGAKSPEGYGRIKYDGRLVSVTRLVVILSGKYIPNGYHVCHTCDNPPCINPDHLFVGTASDNIQDAIKKGRIHSSVKERERLNQETKSPKVKTKKGFWNVVSRGVINRIIAQRRRKVITSLYQSGNYTYEDIGKMYQVSRQRIEQIIKGIN